MLWQAAGVKISCSVPRHLTISLASSCARVDDFDYQRVRRSLKYLVFTAVCIPIELRSSSSKDVGLHEAAVSIIRHECLPVRTFWQQLKSYTYLLCGTSLLNVEF